jgi:hypothetical protein
MFAKRVVATRHSPRNFAHAHLSESYKGSSHGLWTVKSVGEMGSRVISSTRCIQFATAPQIFAVL